MSLSIEMQDGADSLEEENKRLRVQLSEALARMSQLEGEKENGKIGQVRTNRSRAKQWNVREWINGEHRLVPQDPTEIDQEIALARVDVASSGLNEHHHDNAGLHHRQLMSSSSTYESYHETVMAPPPLKAKLSNIEVERASSPSSSCADESDFEDSATNNDGEMDEDMSFVQATLDRAGWLVGLLVLQSCSSFILKGNQGLLQTHTVIVQFLTMLVGAGGNAGNQASVRAIRGLAVGSVRNDNIKAFLWSEFRMGICLSLLLGVVGFIRAAVFLTPLAETMAITTSLLMIVMIAIVIGATLPLLMHYVGIDPAHSSTTIQVLMDILGVTITVVVSGAILSSGLGQWLSPDMNADDGVSTYSAV